MKERLTAREEEKGKQDEESNKQRSKGGWMKEIDSTKTEKN
jgi:hypothetical protein